MEKLPIYKKIGNALVSNTFDLRETDKGWPNINYMIADYLLKDDNDYLRLLQLKELALQVGQNMAFGIDYAESVHGVKIYRGYMKDGKGKMIAFITPDAQYMNAKEKDFSRIFKGAENKYNKSINDVNRRFPEVGADKFQIDFEEKVLKKPCAIGEGIIEQGNLEPNN